jgi:hypothetical protein
MTVLMPIVGALAGVAIGGLFGTAGSIYGGIFGFLVGLTAARLPLLLVFRSIRQGLARQSTDDLRRLLGQEDCLVPDLALRELAARGEDIRSEREVVLQLLESDRPARRRCGWAALKSAFPDLAAQAKGYRPYASTEKSRQRIKALRETIASKNGRF